jgi:hypothetical protein
MLTNEEIEKIISYIVNSDYELKKEDIEWIFKILKNNKENKKNDK